MFFSSSKQVTINQPYTQNTDESADVKVFLLFDKVLITDPFVVKIMFFSQFVILYTFSALPCKPFKLCAFASGCMVPR